MMKLRIREKKMKKKRGRKGNKKQESRSNK
jgi:hypothetical protein